MSNPYCHRCGEICCRCWRAGRVNAGVPLLLLVLFSALLLLLVNGCAAVQSAPGPAVKTNAVVSSLPPALQDMQRTLRAAAPPQPRVQTNGVIALGWTNGEPPETLILNQTTGQSYDAATAAQLTIGGLTVGATNTFIATNSAGASNPVTTAVAADTNYLSYVESVHRFRWNGRAGILQTTSNLVIYTDVGPMPNGGQLVFTNNNRARFYRVRVPGP